MVMKLAVGSPCRESWERMTGNERVRFCGACHKKVFNLSNLSEREIGELLGSGRERPCVRFYQRADGTVMTADCPVGRRRRWLTRLAGVAGTLLLGLAGVLLGQSDPSPVLYPDWFEKILSSLRPKPVRQVLVMGEPALPAPPAPRGRPGSSSQP